MTEPTRRSGIAIATLVLCAFLWGTNAVLGRAVYDDVPPVALSFWRNVFAVAVLLPFTAGALRSAWPTLRANLGVVLAAGVLGTALFNAAFYLALHTTTAINAALIMSLSPVVIPVFALALLGERMSGRELAGIFVSLAGVTLMISRGNPLEVFATGGESGDVLALLAALCWALYSALVKLRPPDLAPVPFLTAILAVAVVALLPFYLWESAVAQPMPATPVAWSAAVYVGLFPTALALLLFNRAVEWIGAIRAGLFVHLVPVFSALLAIGLLDERFTTYQLAGAVPIAVGLYLTTSGAVDVGGAAEARGH